MDAISIFKKNKGYLETRSIKKRNLFYQLAKLQEQGLVEKMKPGLYKHLEIASGNEWEDVARTIPDGVFCLRSACFYYTLSTDIPNEFEMAVANKRKIHLPGYPFIKLYYWDVKYLNVGVVTVREGNANIRIYDKHKTVCDVIRFRNKLDDEMVNQVIKNYLHSKDKNIDALYKYAVIFNIENKIKEYINLFLA